MNLSITGLRLAPDAAIDLHLHTTYSDGHWEPEALLAYLRREGFGLAAITDHDRTDRLAAIQQLAQEQHLPVLVGAEMTTTWQGELVDLLCYGFDPQHPALGELAADLLARQQDNTRSVFQNLENAGYSLPPEALAGIWALPSCQQPHAIVALLKVQDYGPGDLDVGRAAREAGVALISNPPAAVAQAAHQGGGVCILAHPGHGDGFVRFDVDLLDRFRREVPLDGLEVYHPSHTSALVEMYRTYAQSHHLLVSAGSDSHRPESAPIPYRAELCRELLARVDIRI